MYEQYVTAKLPQSHCDDNQEGILSLLHVYTHIYTHIHITPEKGYYVLESFCQNVEVVS